MTLWALVTEGFVTSAATATGFLEELVEVEEEEEEEEEDLCESFFLGSAF